VHRSYISPSLDINYNYQFFYHYFLPPLAGLFTFILDTYILTSQMIVKWSLWPQPCHMMRHEMNLELDNSRDKSDKKLVLLSVKGALHSKYK